jgi:hypothetical protein
VHLIYAALEPKLPVHIDPHFVVMETIYPTTKPKLLVHIDPQFVVMATIYYIYLGGFGINKIIF